nr:unnamed protein product [Spirometra erinaceieuropaei]
MKSVLVTALLVSVAFADTHHNIYSVPMNTNFEIDESLQSGQITISAPGIEETIQRPRKCTTLHDANQTGVELAGRMIRRIENRTTERTVPGGKKPNVCGPLTERATLKPSIIKSPLSVPSTNAEKRNSAMRQFYDGTYFCLEGTFPMADLNMSISQSLAKPTLCALYVDEVSGVNCPSQKTGGFY